MEWNIAANMAHMLDDTDDERNDTRSDIEDFFIYQSKRFLSVPCRNPTETFGCSFTIKERYLLLRNIEKMLISNGVTIFGGYVRDLIIHNHGAKSFYDGIEIEERSGYCNTNVHFSSYESRNTYPNDIDCFLSNPSFTANDLKNLLGTKFPNCVIKAPVHVHCYTHHPEFTLRFTCKRIQFEYLFNHSLQRKGDKINLYLDVVETKQQGNRGPWEYLIDAGCNMLYMDDRGLHHPFTADDPIINAERLCQIIEMTKHKITFMPNMYSSFRTPTAESEIINIQTIRNCTEIQAVNFYRIHKDKFRILYRSKYLHRIAKMVKDGWTFTNLNLIISTSTSSLNGESTCAISHEDLTEGKLHVRLGNRTPNYTQTSVMTWSAFIHYIFSSTGIPEQTIANQYSWVVLCPVSRSHVDITEHRPIGLVIDEAHRYTGEYCSHLV
jgi:hypothetical protein